MITFLAFTLFLQEFRPFEPVVLTGEQLPAFQNQPVEQLFSAIYADGNWTVIPFQVDEKDTEGSYFQPDDGLFDENDEWVVDPSDGGNKTLIGNFGSFPGANLHPRVEVHVTDPLTGQETYIYLFQSSTPPTPSSTSYIQYDQGTDEVSCDHYIIGFDASNRRMDRIQVWEGTQWSDDLLDREKMRAEGTAFFIPYSVNEDYFTPEEVHLVEGPIRVLRQVEGVITYLTISFDMVLENHYYNGMLAFPSGAMSLDPEYGVEKVRVSVDLSPEGSGVQFSCPQIQNVDIDGVPEDLSHIFFSQSDLSSLWFQFSRDNWNIVQIGSYEGIANSNQLYYHDDSNGGTADGTDDTGDGVSYGDTGVILQDFNDGEFAISSKFIVDSTGNIDGPTARTHFLSPLQTSLTPQQTSDALWQLIELWLQPSPDNSDHIITILDMVAVIAPAKKAA
ncbi:MAG: hypothetical protein CR997_10195 [Acidobacteria bacterium]|nr:MAG: hypothetical protein CR997_10195 [Acidobacteriota bacterium]